MVFPEVLLYVHTPDFFLAFHHELDVTRHVACLSQEILDCLNAGYQLALVVCRATAMNVVALDLAAERLVLPQLQRLFRLNVVMIVKHEGLARV